MNSTHHRFGADGKEDFGARPLGEVEGREGVRDEVVEHVAVLSFVAGRLPTLAGPGEPNSQYHSQAGEGRSGADFWRRNPMMVRADLLTSSTAGSSRSRVADSCKKKRGK